MFDMKGFLGFQPQDTRQQLNEPKTTLQTNTGYDERIAIPIDGVIVHRHGAGDEDIKRHLQSWAKQGYVAQRMFFADSDAGWHYTKGDFDGQNHEEDIELTREDQQVLCSGIRPYMLPTDGWINYLKTQVKNAVEGGAEAIYPEEPLAHNHTGYEEAFKKLYVQEYGEPWQGGHESPEAFYKTCRLKNKLYLHLEQQLCDYTKQLAREKGKQVGFYIPIHSMYSNICSKLVAPLGTSLAIQGHQGYIGQIWTGPVRWASANYSNKDCSFFDIAYLLYDYFVNLTKGTDHTLYLLGDPVEDDPSHKWDEYDQWYKECLIAKLMFPSINTYEIMPWPDRIFLPGYKTGGGTPGPDRYRTILMSAATVMQDIPLGQEEEPQQEMIGMLIGDSAMWQDNYRPVLDPFFGLLAPVMKQGVYISSVPVERCVDKEYMSSFRMLLLSYHSWKSDQKAYHENLKPWVENGGVLVIFDSRDEFDSIESFWKQQGFERPQEHLLNNLNVVQQDFTPDKSGLFSSVDISEGAVVMTGLSPKRIAVDAQEQEKYLQLIRRCFRKFIGKPLVEKELFQIKRGDYMLAHTFDSEIDLDGNFLDVYDENLPLRTKVHLQPNASAILLDVEEKMKSDKPVILHSTFRLFNKKEDERETTFFIKGPSETQGRIRLFSAGLSIESLQCKTIDGDDSTAEIIDRDNDTVLIAFPYNAAGTGFKITWSQTI